MNTLRTKKTVYLMSFLCGYGFSVQFSPIAPYIVPYLVQVKHLDIQQVTTKLFPLLSYSILLFTILTTPACRLLSYRVVIIIGTLSVLASNVILLFGKAFFWLQLSLVTTALGLVKDMVFTSYLFLLIKKEEYQLMTSFTKASNSISLLISAELGQLLVSEGAHFVVFIYITLVMAGVACALSIFLPSDRSKSQVSNHLSQRSLPLSRSLIQSMHDLHKAYKENRRIIQNAWASKGLQILTFWWAFTMAGFPMVAGYGTTLFEAISSSSLYNGHVMAATHVVGFLSSFVAVRLSRTVDQTGGLAYFLGSILVGILCILMAYAKSLWIAYAAYVVNIGINDLLLCLSVVQCAKSISDGQYILVFSFNSLGGLVMQAVFQAIIEIIGISIFTQYLILGIYFLLVAFVFGLICIGFYFRTGCFVLVPTESSLPTYGTFQDMEN